MMERLRAKRFLGRKRADGIYLYAALESSEGLLRDLVRHFVEGRLAGSVSPVVSYLVERAEVSESELAQLEGLVARLQSKRGPRGRKEK
jgi:predicted transcriptional regulator